MTPPFFIRFHTAVRGEHLTILYLHTFRKRWIGQRLADDELSGLQEGVLDPERVARAIETRGPTMPPSPTQPSRKRSRLLTDHVIVENVNHPASRRRVDGPKYRAMRRALLTVVPRRAPGATLATVLAAVIPRLPAGLFPG